MSMTDDNSLLGVVVLPALGGAVGYLLAGSFGLVAGLVLLLATGAYAGNETTEVEERIADLEARVTEFEDANENGSAVTDTSPDESRPAEPDAASDRSGDRVPMSTD